MSIYIVQKYYIVVVKIFDEGVIDAGYLQSFPILLPVNHVSMQFEGHQAKNMQQQEQQKKQQGNDFQLFFSSAVAAQKGRMM